MIGRRRGRPGAARQVPLPWTEAGAILDSAEQQGGTVLFEAPEAAEVARERVPRVPRIRARRCEPPSLGLPFGVRVEAGRVTCWSCARDLSEADLVHAGPGTVTCPGCGARLPFAE